MKRQDATSQNPYASCKQLLLPPHFRGAVLVHVHPVHVAILAAEVLAEEVAASFDACLLRRDVGVGHLRTPEKEGQAGGKASGGRQKLLWGWRESANPIHHRSCGSD